MITPKQDPELRAAIYNYYRDLVGPDGDVHHATVQNGLELVASLIGDGELSRA